MLHVLLLDDQPLALRLIESFLQRHSDMQLCGAFTSAQQAIKMLESQPIDILFLDIQMPFINGLQLLRQLENPPVVIFSTAYSEYAVQAFELDAADYLVKPFSYARFEQALQKARMQAQLRQNTEQAPFILIKTDGALCKIFIRDIAIIEGLKEYVRIICDGGKKYVTLEALKNLQEILPADQFVRVHKSYIIAKSKITVVAGNEITIGEQKIPISRDRRSEVMAELGNW